MQYLNKLIIQIISGIFLFFKLNLLNIDFSYSNFTIINLLSLFIIIIIIFLKSVSQNLGIDGTNKKQLNFSKTNLYE